MGFVPSTLRKMNTRLWLGLCLLLAACPERRAPERGIQLVYKKARADSVRSVVDRRLAHLKLRANLSEDETTLTVRAPEGADVTRIKALFAEAGRLEFCPEDLPIATRWCALKWPEGVSTATFNSTCSLRGAPERLAAALVDAGIDFAVDATQGPAAAYPLGSCFEPRIISAELQAEPMPHIALVFDRESGRQFGEVTKALVGHRLIIRLNGAVHSAPTVQSAITGGKAMLTVGADQNQASMQVLAAALVGGSLPVMELLREETWGPPAFGR